MERLEIERPIGERPCAAMDPCIVKNEAGQTRSREKITSRSSIQLGIIPGRAIAAGTNAAIRQAPGQQALVSWFPRDHLRWPGFACIAIPNQRAARDDPPRQSAWARTLHDGNDDSARRWTALRAVSQNPDRARRQRALLHQPARGGGSQVYVWNDMFDPFHNSVKGPTTGERPWTVRGKSDKTS